MQEQIIHTKLDMRNDITMAIGAVIKLSLAFDTEYFIGANSW